MSAFSHEFVEFIPSKLKRGVIYISIPYATATHNCACGCGRKVVTPLTPTDWKLIFDGETVSLSPSIGNWSLECRSHYWILRNRVKWARRWIKAEIDEARAIERNLKSAYYAEHPGESGRDSQEDNAPRADAYVSLETVMSRIKRFWRG
jgi:hypothetical protein